LLRKRIIFTLIYESGFFNQSRNFRLQKVGNLNWLKRNYNFKELAFSLDELIVVNASKDKKKIEEFAKILEGIVEDVFIPIAAGGGIRDIDDAKLLFNSGADKLILNSLLYTRPDLVKNLVQQYGSQSLVASIDYRKLNGNIAVFINDGTKKIDMNIEDYLKYVENLDIGEIYLNSIDRDGTGFGYDFDTIDNHTNQLKKPLIIAGGAGNADHLIQGLKREKVDAVATANLFNFIGDGLVNAREEIISKNLNIAKWAKR
jgi:cyclase